MVWWAAGFEMGTSWMNESRPVSIKTKYFMSVLILLLLVLSNICKVESWRVLRENGDSVNFDAQHHYHHKQVPQSHESRAYSTNQYDDVRRSPAVVHDGDDGHEIDPRYGVEKRMVPTGPNPLHH